MTNSFCSSASVSFRVLGAEGEALDSGGEIKLTHLLTQAAVGHVRLGGQIHRCFYGNPTINLMNKKHQFKNTMGKLLEMH